MSVKCLQIFFLAHPIESKLSHGGGFFWLALIWRPMNRNIGCDQHRDMEGVACAWTHWSQTNLEENTLDKDCSLPFRPKPLEIDVTFRSYELKMMASLSRIKLKLVHETLSFGI